MRTPRRLRWIGRRNDYSYGVYIYGFIGQQVFASLGWSRWGYLPYIAMSLAAAFAAAALSWHLVERRALAWKDWTPRRLRGPRSSESASTSPRLPAQAHEPVQVSTSAMLRGDGGARPSATLRGDGGATPVAGRTG